MHRLLRYLPSAALLMLLQAAASLTRPTSFIAILVAGLLLWNSGPAGADLLGPAPRSEKTTVFGDTEITSIVDGYESTFRISHKGEMKALLQHVFFEHLFALPDNSLFVGLSNSGHPGSAIGIFTPEGRIFVLVYHGAAEFDYCNKSVTVVRHWYDEQNPNLRFITDEKTGSLQAITLRDCRGLTVDLLDVIAEAYSRAAQAQRKRR